MQQDALLRDCDPVQVALMQEECIQVDEQDAVLGPVSKKTSHLMENISSGMLHRAFSVFLFNSENKLLMHKRSSDKITFPGYWTNTCCSHPLFFAEEMDTTQGNIGVKRAAVRKMEQELGITSVSIEDLTYISRLHYLAPSDGVWGEHEIDHVLILKGDFEYSINPNEIEEVKYFSKDEMREFIDTAEAKGVNLSPWFLKIKEKWLWEVWDNLNDLSKVQDWETIHRL